MQSRPKTVPKRQAVRSALPSLPMASCNQMAGKYHINGNIVSFSNTEALCRSYLSWLQACEKSGKHCLLRQRNHQALACKATK